MGTWAHPSERPTHAGTGARCLLDLGHEAASLSHAWPELLSWTCRPGWPGADAYHTLNSVPGPVRLPKTLQGGSSSSVFWSTRSERFRDPKQLAQGHTANKNRAETDFQSLCLSEFQTRCLVMSLTAQAVRGSSLWRPCLHTSSNGQLTFSQDNMSLGRT